MFVLWKWLRWLFGYTVFEIRGAYGEQFITLCMKQGIDLWEIRRVCPGIIRAKTFLSMRKRLDPLARKSGTTLDFCSDAGLLVTLKRYRLRVGLFLGMVLYVAVLVLLPSFVWSVEIPGANPVQQAQIRSVLLESGFGIGSYLPSVDFKELKYRLMLASDDISFISVNMKGCRAVVDVRFAQEGETPTPEPPCNLVASRDGQILSILVRDGVRYVQKGQTVQKGDLLVGGIVDTRLGYYLVHSDAQILARVTEVEHRTVSLTQTVTTRTGRSCTKREWNFFGTVVDGSPWFSCPYAEYETVTEKCYLSFGEESAVPVFLTKTVYYETVSEEVSIAPQEAETLARSFLEEAARLRYYDDIVESVSETVTVSPQDVTVTRTRSLIVDICEEKEIYFDNEG